MVSHDGGANTRCKQDLSRSIDQLEMIAKALDAYDILNLHAHKREIPYTVEHPPVYDRKLVINDWVGSSDIVSMASPMSCDSC